MDILIKRKLLTEMQYLEAQSMLYAIPFWPRLPLERMENEMNFQIPIQFLKRYFLIPMAIRAEGEKPENSSTERDQGGKLKKKNGSDTDSADSLRCQGRF